MLLALGVELYLLLYDIPLLRNPPVSDPQNASREAIAELVSKINTVRVQSPGEIIWEETAEGQKLFRSQSVLTLERSRAEIAFLDGTAFVLGENSLVRLERNAADQPDADRIVVRLDRGTLSKRVPTEHPLSLEIDGVLANFQPSTEFTLSRDASGKNAPRLLIQKGGAELLTSLGKISISEGQEAVLPKSSQLSRGSEAPQASAPSVPRKIELTPISPRAWESVVLADAGAVSFQWRVDLEWAEDPKSAGKKQIVEAAQDPFFQSGVRSVAVPLQPQISAQASISLPASMSPVLWYWRVRIEGEENTSLIPVEAFWLQGKQAPRIRFPEENVSVPRGSAIPLSWAPLEEVVDYEIEIRGPEGTKIQKSADRQLRMEDLPTGAFTWRVRGHFKEGHFSPWSEERRFTVIPQPTPAEQLLLPPPPREFLKPEIRPLKKPSSSISIPPSFWEWLLPTAHAASDAEEGTWAIELKWKPVPGVTRYKVQVSRSLDFKKIIGEGEAESPAWNFNYRAGMENSSGALHYRVASIDPDGQWGNYSKPEKVEIPEEILRKSRTKAPREVYGAYEKTVLEAPSANIEKEVARDGKEFFPSVRTLEPVPRPWPPRKPKDHRWWIGFYTGLGKDSQKSSSSNPRSVRQDSLYWRQRLEGSYQSTPGEWSIDLSVGFASFSKVPQENGKIPQQSDFSGFEARMDLVFQEIFAEPSEEVRWNWGATAERAFRFVKDGPQSVTAKGALSLGPLVQAMRHYSYGENWGGRLRLPVSGLLTRGFASLEGRLWREWQLYRFKKTVQGVSLRIETEGSYSLWMDPSGTQVTSWAVSIGPHFFF